MRDKILQIILNHRYIRDPRDNDSLQYSSMGIADRIMELIAPELRRRTGMSDFQKGMFWGAVICDVTWIIAFLIIFFTLK